MGLDSHHEPLVERLAPDAAEPDSDDPVVKMAWYLKTHEGKAHYAKRKCTAEPVFGIIKQAMGFRQFSRRSLETVEGEWKLVAMDFNLPKRMHSLEWPSNAGRREDAMPDWLRSNEHSKPRRTHGKPIRRSH